MIAKYKCNSRTVKIGKKYKNEGEHKQALYIFFGM